MVILYRGREINDGYYRKGERRQLAMKKDTVIKIIGIGGTLLGLAATLVNNYSNEQTMKKTVAEEVAKALADK